MSKIIGVTVGTPLSASVIKEKIKPVTSVNGVKADESGNVNVATVDVDVQEVVEAALAEAKASGAFDGKDGYTPIKDVDYRDGIDGVSPKVSVSPITGGHSVTFTSAYGPVNFDVMNGKTPVKGQDYYTQADKDEMVASVIAALPVYNGEVENL